MFRVKSLSSWTCVLFSWQVKRDEIWWAACRWMSNSELDVVQSLGVTCQVLVAGRLTRQVLTSPGSPASWLL